jgi:hypothetical protein
VARRRRGWLRSLNTKNYFSVIEPPPVNGARDFSSVKLRLLSLEILTPLFFDIRHPFERTSFSEPKAVRHKM